MFCLPACRYTMCMPVESAGFGGHIRWRATMWVLETHMGPPLEQQVLLAMSHLSSQNVMFSYRNWCQEIAVHFKELVFFSLERLCNSQCFLFFHPAPASRKLKLGINSHSNAIYYDWFWCFTSLGFSCLA